MRIVSYLGKLLSCFALYTKYATIARTASLVSIKTGAWGRSFPGSKSTYQHLQSALINMLHLVCLIAKHQFVIFCFCTGTFQRSKPLRC